MPNKSSSSEPNTTRTQGGKPVLVALADLEPAQPVTRLHPATREVGFIRNGREVYFVDLDRADTAGKVLGWILQLTGKTWITPGHVREFVQHVQRENRIMVDRNI